MFAGISFSVKAGELLALTGDAGARAIVAGNRDLITFIDVDDPGVIKDIDTPADLAGH